MEGHVQSKTQGKCPTPERVEKEGRQHLDAQRDLEESTSKGETGGKKKQQQHVASTTPGNRDGIWDDDDSKDNKADWVSQADEVEKAIDSPSGARFYQHD
ncbi:hypothetical protein PG993_004353 [Apiospora rasikravindrae]|uniref:Uncharacterized protein n=1 Tax=Apiospora rasikravindrae TaxID=990691 RepID=A0ABR1TEX8_9PEZI